MNNNQPAKRRPGAKKIVLGVCIALSALMIVLALVVVMNLLFAKNIRADVLTDNLSDFVTLYQEGGSASQLPRGLEITASACTVAADGKTFRYTLGVKNNLLVDQQLEYQIYFTEDYEREYGKNSGNPMDRATAEAPLTLKAGETHEISVSGVVLGRGEGATEIFKEKMAEIYAEFIVAGDVGRILLPVNFS